MSENKEWFTKEKTDEEMKKARPVIWILSHLVGFWFAKQRYRYIKEKETGVKEPMDGVDKVGWLVVGTVIILFILAAIGVIMLYIYGLFTGK